MGSFRIFCVGQDGRVGKLGSFRIIGRSEAGGMAAVGELGSSLRCATTRQAFCIIRPGRSWGDADSEIPGSKRDALLAGHCLLLLLFLVLLCPQLWVHYTIKFGRCPILNEINRGLRGF